MNHALDILSRIAGTRLVEQFGNDPEDQPTINDVNKLLQGINIWLEKLRYSLLNITRGPQVGSNGLAAMAKYRAGERIISIHVDITEDWTWTILFIMDDLSGEELGREEKVVQNPDVEQVAEQLKDILKKLPSDDSRPLTFEAVFRHKLLQSTVYLIESEYDSFFKR